VENT
jgi:hypothetical protein